MPRDRVGKTRAQHHKLVLPFGFGRPHCAAHSIVEPPQLCLGAAVHIFDAAHDAVRLVIKIQTVGQQFVEIDVGKFKTPLAAAGPAEAPLATTITPTVAAPITTAIRTAIPTWWTTTLRPAATTRAPFISAAAFARRTVLRTFVLRLLFSHF